MRVDLRWWRGQLLDDRINSRYKLCRACDSHGILTQAAPDRFDCHFRVQMIAELAGPAIATISFARSSVVDAWQMQH